jgi:hypothetical protein
MATLINPIDERSMHALVGQRRQRLLLDAHSAERSLELRNLTAWGRPLRHQVGARLIRLGIWVSGTGTREPSARLQT